MNAPCARASPPQESGLAWLSGRMLRDGGYVVIEVEAHFDESGTHAGSPMMCVAGYIISKDRVADFDRDWNAVLNWDQLPHPLPYFRMSQCAPEPPSGPFVGIDKKLRIQIVSRLIAAIKRNAAHGLAVSMNEAEYQRLMPAHPLLGKPYTFCAHVILAGVSSWIDANPHVENAAYFFESGHQSQPEADAIMTLLFRNEPARKRHRYAGHAFVPKVGNPGVQAADLLAWQWYTDERHKIEGRPRRKDCASLLEHPHNAVHLGADKIVQLAERFGNIMPDAETFERLYLGDPKPQRRR